jgi:hypothetical protein
MGYTAPFALGKSPSRTTMKRGSSLRPIVLILLLAIIVGGLWYLSTVPSEVPARTIEADVAQPADAR